MVMVTTPSFSTPGMRRRQREARQSPYMTKFRPRRFGEPAVATPSPGLKETLRKACLENARTKRQNLVLQKRRVLTQENSQSIGEEVNDNDRPARQVVEEELKRRGVTVHQRCFDEDVEFREASSGGQCDHPTTEPNQTPIQNHDSVDINRDGEEGEIPSGDTYISEDDLFDLLQVSPVVVGVEVVKLVLLEYLIRMIHKI